MVNSSLPFVFEPSNQWLGNDGWWSTFTVKIGTPPQEFQILPATNTQETWVPVPLACSSYNISDCPQQRGASNSSFGFISNRSSTWEKEGIYNLVSEAWLGYVGNGDYGFDTVEIGNSTRGVKVEHQVVAGIVEEDFWVGLFGLGPKPANFSGFNDPQPSFMRSLVNQSLIPSLSYGYTAGAKYRSSAGSLTLGGYDTSRFTPNDAQFTFAPDDSRSLTVGIQSITLTNAFAVPENRHVNGTDEKVAALSDGIYSLIDSTVPHIWLPVPACDIFEKAFALIYDNHTNLYLINETTHSLLKDRNPTVTFTLGNSITGGSTVDIALPYSAFDLQIGFPTYDHTEYYFPLRRAANDTQYTIGRTFLQEAYITVDYERQNFSVAQALFPSTTPSASHHIVPIPPLAPGERPSSIPHSSRSSGLSTGIIVAIVLISTAFLIIISLVSYGLYKRHRRRKRTLSDPTTTNNRKDSTHWLKARRKSNTRRWIHELHANSANEKAERVYSASEHPAWREGGYYGRGEGVEKPPLTFIRRQELPGTAAAQELEGRRKVRDTGGSLTPIGRMASWAGRRRWEEGGEGRGAVEMPGHEARSNRGSMRTWVERMGGGG